jgi:hypothetical protein
MRLKGFRLGCTSMRNPRRAGPYLALGVLCALLRPAVASAVDLYPVLTAPGTTVTLNSSTTYTIAGIQLTSDKTIDCNGATIDSTNPIWITGAGVRLVVDDCNMTGSGWALLEATDGAQMVVQNGTMLTGNGANDGIYVADSTLEVDGGTIAECQVGVLAKNSDATHHGVTFSHTLWGVQGWASTVTLDGGCQLTNLDPTTPGAGVDLRPSPTYPSRPAVGVIHDATFKGFGNVVETEPGAAQGLPPSTAEIVGCTFDGPAVSAVIAVDGNVHFANSTVTNALHDGLFFENSIGLVENAQVIGSQNSGVSFYGCPNGGMLRNSLVTGSAHQGVAIVVDPSTNLASHGVRVVDNTFKGNVLANVLVDDHCDAVVQGNVFSGAPDMSVRFQGGSTSLVAGLLLDSQAGLEMKNGAAATAALSVFTGHQSTGATIYGNANATVSHCDFESNALDASVPEFSIIVASGAQLTLGRSSLGPAGDRALFNKAGNTCTAGFDWWGDASGPQLATGGGGSGSIVGWAKGGSKLIYDPVLSSPPVASRIERAFQLVAGSPTEWTPDLDLTLSLTGASAIGSVPPGLVAGLRVYDASTLSASAPPVGTYDDGVVAVWIDYAMLSLVQTGSLRFHTSGDGAHATLSELGSDGQWAPVTTRWDDAAGEIVYVPSDPTRLNGVFAIGNGVGEPACATARDCLQPLIAGPLCAERIDARLQKAIGRKLHAAMTKLTKAATGVATSKLTHQALKALQAIESLAARSARARKAPISTQCRDTIDLGLEPAMQRIAAGAL